jgi:hypothetical protein
MQISPTILRRALLYCKLVAHIRREKIISGKALFWSICCFFDQGFTQEVNQLCDPSAPDVLSTIIQVFPG